MGGAARHFMKYDPFISYSHEADGALAPAVQTALRQLARPWNRRHALRVFRDDTGLSVTRALWPAIESALAAWEFGVDAWMRRACLAANRQLTAGEWLEHVGEGVPYRQTCERG